MSSDTISFKQDFLQGTANNRTGLETPYTLLMLRLTQNEATQKQWKWKFRRTWTSFAKDVEELNI